MLNCTLENGQGVIFAKGSLREIMADVTILVKHIYDELDEDAAEVFKEFVKELLIDLPFEDVKGLEKMEGKYKKMAEQAKKDSDNAKKELDELLKDAGLKDIVEDLSEFFKNLRDSK